MHGDDINTSSYTAATGYVGGQKYCFINYSYSYGCSTSGAQDGCNCCLFDSTKTGPSYGTYPNPNPNLTSLTPDNNSYGTCGETGTTVSVSVTLGPLAANTYYQTAIAVGPFDPTTNSCSGNANSYDIAGISRYNGDISAPPTPQ